MLGTFSGKSSIVGLLAAEEMPPEQVTQAKLSFSAAHGNARRFNWAYLIDKKGDNRLKQMTIKNNFACVRSKLWARPALPRLQPSTGKIFSFLDETLNFSRHSSAQFSASRETNFVLIFFADDRRQVSDRFLRHARYTKILAQGSKYILKTSIAILSLLNSGLIFIFAALAQFYQHCRCMPTCSSSERMRVDGRFDEIALCAKNFGAQQIIVAIGRMDEFGEKASGRFEECKASALQRLAKAGFDMSTVLGVVPVSAIDDGVNIVDNKQFYSWYTGPSVLQLVRQAKKLVRFYYRHLAVLVQSRLLEFSMSTQPRNTDGDAFAVVDEVIRVPGIGHIVQASMLRGCVSDGQYARLFPLKETLPIGSFEFHHHRQQSVQAGEFVGINTRYLGMHRDSIAGVKQYMLFLNRSGQPIPQDAFVPRAVDCFVVDAVIHAEASRFASSPAGTVQVAWRFGKTNAVMVKVEKLNRSDDASAPSSSHAQSRPQVGDRIRITLKCCTNVVVAAESDFPELCKVMLNLDCPPNTLLASATVLSIVTEPDVQVKLGN
jgi:translation elongation factor EF-1alpha